MTGCDALHPLGTPMLSDTCESVRTTTPHRASGFNHSVLVLVTNDTTADLQTAQQQFVNDTLISSHSADGAPAARVYLGPIPGELYIAPGKQAQYCPDGRTVRHAG